MTNRQTNLLSWQAKRAEPDGPHGDRRSGVLKSSFPLLSGRTAAWVIIAIGIYLRIVQFFSLRCLWIDECFLALNVLSRGILELAAPLDLNQAAPVLFLFSQKAMVLAFGPHEFSLRAMPLVAGVASLLIFSSVARRILSPATACIAVGMFGFSDVLIYYAVEAKQYSWDILVTVSFLYLGLVWCQPRSMPPKLLICFFAGIGGLAASFTAPFSLAAVGFAWLSLDPRKHFVHFVKMGSVWGATFVVFWLVFFRHTSSNEFLLNYWDFAYAPIPPSSMEDCRWYWYAFLELLDIYDLRHFWLPASALLVLGLWRLFSQQKAVAFLCVLPVLLTLMASAVERYPFSGRLIVFLAPLVSLVVGKGIDVLCGQEACWKHLLIGAILVAPNVYWSGKSHMRHQQRCEIRPMLMALSKESRPGDLVYFSWHASILHSYYRQQYGELPEGVELVYEERENQVELLERRLAAEPKLNRVWSVHARTLEWRGDDVYPLVNSQLASVLGSWGSFVAARTDRGVELELYQSEASYGPLAEH